MIIGPILAIIMDAGWSNETLLEVFIYYFVRATTIVSIILCFYNYKKEIHFNNSIFALITVKDVNLDNVTDLEIFMVIKTNRIIISNITYNNYLFYFFSMWILFIIYAMTFDYFLSLIKIRQIRNN